MSASQESSEPGRLVAIVRWSLVAGAFALAAFSVGRSAGWFERAPVASAYVCPMHPEVRGDQGDLCPVCHMRLVARGPAPAAVPRVVHPASAGTVQVTRRRIERALSAPATIAVPDAQLISVSARAQGWIATLPVAEIGRRVTRGQVLATLDSPELFRAQQKFLNAQRWSRSGTPNIQPSHDGDSTGDLVGEARLQLRLAGLSDGDITAIAAEGKPRRAVALRAPMDGVVIRKQAERGGFAAVGQELFAIADLGVVWAVADVPESDVGRLRVGEPVEVRPAGGDAVQGRVVFIHPTAEEGARTVKVRVELANPAGALRPGTSATVHMAGAAADVLVVPAASVVDTGRRPVVFVAERGRTAPRAVVLGARTGDEVEIASGLREGEEVVAEGAFLLEAESRSRAVQP